MTLRARDRFERAGAQIAAARCELLLAHFAQFGRPGQGIIPLSVRYRRRAERRVDALGASDPLLEASRLFVDGWDAIRLARWDAAEDRFERASELLERDGSQGTLEHLLVRSYACLIPFYSQRPEAMRVAVGRFQAAAAGTGETAVRTHLSIATMGLALLRGRIEVARAQIDEAKEALPSDRKTIQRDVVARMDCWVGAYDRDPARCLAVLEETRRDEWRYGLRTCAQGSMYAGIAALTEARALRAGVPSASARRLRREARAAHASPPIMWPLATRALAYGADARGRPDEALRRLEQAERQAEAAGQPIDVAIARHQRGGRLGGDEGAALRRAARATLDELGVDARILEEDV